MSSVAARDWYAKNKFTLIDKIQSSQDNAQTYKKDSEDPNSNKIGNLFLNFSLIAIIFILTYILIHSTTEVVGRSLVGYLKAFSLEIGILLLTFLSPKSFLDKIFKHSVLICSFLLSFFVLHSGATIGAAESHKSIEQNNMELVNLNALRTRLLSNHDSLPTNFTSKRNELIAQVKEIDAKISSVLSATKQSPAVTALNAATNTEIWSRAVFLLMNLFFTHQLAQRFRSRRQEAIA